MNRETALIIAKAQFNALNRALFAFWSGKRSEPVESDYGYRHGWISVAGYSFRSDELSDGAPQPIMD